LKYDKKILWLILIATAARIIIASSIGLGNDEVYYWTYAVYPQWNYFDHPPIVGWLIRLTTANLLLHNELFVRIGAIISSAICTFIIYKTATIVQDHRTGWYAALLYTASIYGSIIAGTFILPDSPQMVFWLWSIFLLIKIVNLPVNDRQSGKLWLLFGMSSGLCIMCKVHGVFLWFAVALYAIFINRNWLRNKNMYLAGVITLLIISPIVIWNIQNNFITYSYHGSRVSLTDAGIQIDGFVRELAGSFFYNNPINFVLIWSSIIAFWRGRLATNERNFRLLLCCGLPLISVLLMVSLFRETLPHWSGPGYSCLIILAAARLASSHKNQSNRIPAILKSSLAFIAILSFVGILIINYFPGTLSPQKAGDKTGDGDFTLDMYGWKKAGALIDSIYKRDVAQNAMPADAPIIVNKWFPAAHIDFYIASKTGQQTYALGNLFDIHEYYWYNKYKTGIKRGGAAYFIVPSNLYKQEDVEQLKKSFDSVLSPEVIPVYRSGTIAKTYYVFRLKGYNSGFPYQ
jgi:4-amino-4-deoxy-L-arabinose transferase-like glycosyltransferase